MITPQILNDYIMSFNCEDEEYCSTYGSQKRIFSHEQDAQNHHTGVQFAPSTAQQMQHHPADKPHHDAIGDGIAQRHEEDTDENRNGCQIVAPIDVAHIPHHHHAYQHQGSSGGLGRNGQEKGRQQQSQHKAHGRNE